MATAAPFPRVVPMADHRGAGVQRVPRRPIPGAVVDDDDGRGVRQCAPDHVRDLVLFVERGDPHDDFRIEELRHGCGLPLINVMAANHRGRRTCSTGPILAPRPYSGGRASDEQFDRDLDRSHSARRGSIVRRRKGFAIGGLSSLSLGHMP